jgi:AAA family ATPase
VGEAESVIRKVFTLARAAAPCILFFDEVDSIFGNGDKARGSSAEARVLSTFLNEMDGIDKKTSDSGVLVLGATNRPWTLDLALLRPGRLGDKIVMVPPPDTTARKEILLMQFPGQKKWDWETLSGILSKGMTGAEIIGACQEAKIRLLKEMKIVTAEENQFESKFTMKQEYLEDSLRAVKPLLSKPEALEEFRIFEHQFQK